MDLRARRILLLLAPWPLIPGCVVPRLVRESPATAAKHGVVLAFYASVAAAVAWLQPALLIVLAALSATATVAQIWHGLPGYGARRGWPPGGLRLFPVRPFLHHAHVQSLHRRHGPVVKANLPLYTTPHTVCIHGLERGAQVLRQEEEDDALRWPGIIYDRVIPARFIRGMAPVDHAVYRRVIRTALADSVVEGCRADIRRLANEAVRSLEAEIAASAGAGVDIRPHLRSFTLDAVCRLFVGLRTTDDGLAEARSLLGLRGPLGDFPACGVDAIAVGARRLQAQVEGSIRDAQIALAAHERPVPSFAAELAERCPEYTVDENVLLNLVFGCATAVRDVTGLLHWIVKMLVDAPEWQGRARADATGDVSTWIVLETLRLEQSEFIIRRVRRPIAVSGFTIPEGWLLRISVRESHRSADAFDEPERFDPGRFEGQRFRRAEYAPFGLGRHACLGVATTMAIAEELVQALTREHELVATRDGKVEFDHAHWRPSRHMRVRLAPVSSSG